MPNSSALPHQFWPGAVQHQLPPQCCPHQFWPGAVHTDFGPVLSHNYSGLVLSCNNSGLVLYRTNYCPNAACTNSGPALFHTYSGPLLFTSITAPVLPAPVLARYCPHQFWPSAACTRSGSVLSALILAHWLSAARTNSGLEQLAPIPAKCSSHLSLPSVACTWLSKGECMSVTTSSEWRLYAGVISHPQSGVERLGPSTQDRTKTIKQTTKWTHRITEWKRNQCIKNRLQNGKQTNAPNTDYRMEKTKPVGSGSRHMTQTYG